MKSSQVRRRRLVFLTEVTVALGLATALAARLNSYDVPLLWVVPCWSAVACSLMELFDRFVKAWSVTTYFCPDATCDFKVTLQDVDAAENRRWQEIAAAHPHRM